MAANDMAEMREALQQALYFLRRHHMGAVYAPDGETLIYCEDVADIVAKALAKPPRNCDVGSAEEQEGRFTEVCAANSRDGVRGLCSETCPFGRDYQSECALAWAQLPYKAERRGEGE